MTAGAKTFREALSEARFPNAKALTTTNWKVKLNRDNCSGKKTDTGTVVDLWQISDLATGRRAIELTHQSELTLAHQSDLDLHCKQPMVS